MLLLYILWDDWPIFMISGSKEQLQQELEYTLLKPDWLSQLVNFKNANWTLQERYSIKFCFKLGKNAMRWKLDLLLWPKRPRDRVPSGSMLALLDPRRPDRGKSTHKLLMIPFLTVLAWSTLHWFPSGQTVNNEYYVEVLREFMKRFRQKVPSTLQIGSVAFPPGQCTSPQLHPFHRLFDQDGHQDSSSASL